MRTRIATITLVLLAVTGPAAEAGPTEVNVRIEGHSETLFEGPIVTEGRNIEASSDSLERLCDGLNPNDPQNVTPGPTPTAASVDAMSLIGEVFDGRWYPGYDDYFITRWGPDSEAQGMSWGVLANDVYTSVGGCQYELHTGDEVLWVYDAFAGRPLLALLPAADGYVSGIRPLTATAELGKPFEVEVLAYTKHQEGEPPAVPERAGSVPYEDADVSPVATSARGFEAPQPASLETVKTDTQGKASITFTTPGWHRIKATGVSPGGEENAIRSNRLDVCVPAIGTASCGEPPAEDLVRTPSRYAEKTHEETNATGTGAGASADTQPKPAGPGANTTEHTASSRPARLVVESITHARLLVKFTSAGQATVRIARLLGKRPHRRWRTIKTIAIKTSNAGQIKVRLSWLAAGHYHVSISLHGGESVMKTLVVPRR